GRQEECVSLAWEVRFGSVAIIAPGLPERAHQRLNSGQLRRFGRFLPLPPGGGGSLDWRPTVVRTEGNEHPALARRGAAEGEAARARRARALGCRARRAAAWLRNPGAQRGRAGAQPDRRFWLVARALERGSAALSRTGGHRAGALRDPQGGGGAGAAAFSRGAAHRTDARGPRGDAHLPPGAAA